MRRTILVVDDEPLIVDLLKSFMEIERYDVLTATSVEEALDKLKEHAVHAVVSDIMLPGSTGMDLLVDVKTNYPGIPVILITGESGQYTPQVALEAGADGFFNKPFHNIELTCMLKRVLWRSSPTTNSLSISEQA